MARKGWVQPGVEWMFRGQPRRAIRVWLEEQTWGRPPVQERIGRSAWVMSRMEARAWMESIGLDARLLDRDIPTSIPITDLRGDDQWALVDRIDFPIAYRTEHR